MTRSRKIFIFFVVLFVAFLVFTVVDISRRTTFPGAKKREKADSTLKTDTLRSDSSAKSAIHPR